MANKKLKNFEFANHTEKGNLTPVNTDEVVFFECSNGSVFLICQNSATSEFDVSPSRLAAERIRYYLENEFVVNPVSAIYNALVYTNGFIYEYARKNSEYSGAYVHCCCLLIRDNKAYFSTLGDVSAYFFNGRKLFLVSKGKTKPVSESVAKESENELPSDVTDVHGFLLGMSREINPDVNIEPLVPVNEDVVLLCSKGLYENVPDKSIVKVLSDPMPVQTKVYRLVDMASVAGSNDNISMQLVSFYNLDHTERSFKPLPMPKYGVVRKKTSDEEKDTSSDDSSIMGYFDRANKPWVRTLLILAVTVLLSYMFYDIFLRDPMPPVNVVTRQPEPSADTPAVATTVQETLPASQPAVSSVKIPDDIIYQVRSGDTWGSIYTQYGVCSWFIRNHPPNRGKFDNDDNPVAGSRINIPVVYSARRQYNPDFYQEFTIQKTGSRCENANEAFLERFKAQHL